MDHILTGIGKGMQDEQTNNEIRLTALKALQDGLPLLSTKMQIEPVREFLLSQLIKCFAIDNHEIVLKSVQCLIDMYKSCYEFLTRRYMDVIFDKILELMNSKHTSIVIASTEFINSACIHEQSLVKKIKFGTKIEFHNFIEEYSKKLTESLLKLLMKKDNEDMDSGLSVHSAVYQCLLNVNLLAGETNLDMNKEFVGQMIMNEESRFKVCALICFDAMIEGYNIEINGLIENSIFQLIAYLKPEDPPVCLSTLKVIKSVSSKYPFILLDDKICVEWLEVIIRIIQSYPAYSPDACSIFNNLGSITLARNLDGYFSSKSEFLAIELMKTGLNNLNPKNLDYMSNCFIASMSIVKGIRAPPSFSNILDFLAESLGKVNMLTGDCKYFAIEGLLLVSLTLVYMMKKRDIQIQQIKKESLRAVYESCLRECHAKSTNYSDALQTVVGIAVFIKNEIDSAMFDELCKLSSEALKTVNNESLMGAGIQVVGDLTRNFPSKMEPNISGILNYLIECLHNPSLMKSLRGNIFTTIGDLAIGCPAEVKKDLDKILSLYLLAYDAVLQIYGSNPDETNLDFANCMKISAIESLSCVCHGLLWNDQITDEVTIRKLMEFLPNLNLFISKVLEDKFNPEESFVELVCLLMCDLAAAFKGKCNSFDRHLLLLLKKMLLVYDRESHRHGDTISYFEGVFKF